MNILITGGAGYIGSHMVLKAVQAGHNVVVLDNLSTGFKQAVIDAKLIVGDLNDEELLDQVLQQYCFDAVMHFAASISVADSVYNPDQYYSNNVNNTIKLLNALAKHQVKYFIFSSTAAIFGEPKYIPIDNKHPQQPINPYGKSKWLIEQILPDYARAFGLRFACLRYFNAAGFDPSGKLKDRQKKPSHLIPVLLQAAAGIRETVEIFGTDYATKDGTCIRDYVHVNDLAAAHLLALEQLQQQQSCCYNLGNGQGFSVKEVIAALENVSGRKIKVIPSARRAGDPAELIADSSAAKRELDWQPQFTDIEVIVKTAL